MGPAPRAGRHPAMPDPVRLVRQSVAAAEREYGSVHLARRKILAVVGACRYWVGTGNPADDWWLDELWLAACAEAQVPMLEAPGRKDNRHGNRSTSSGETGAGTGEAET